MPFYYTGFPFRFGPGACCCPGCWWFADNFDRFAGGTTDLGSNWNEVTGKWGLLAYELVENYDDGGGTANAVVMCTQQAPSMSDNGLDVSVHIMEAEEEEEFFIYVHATDSDGATGAKVIKFQRLTDDPVDGEQWEVTIDGGVSVIQKPSKVEPYDDPGSVSAYVCTDNRAEQIKAGVVSLDEFAWDDNITPGAGRYVGLGHDNEKETGYGVRFDNFFVTELRTPEVACTDCYCFCDTFAVPKTVNAEITDAVDRASCLSGVTWSMEYEWDAMGSNVQAWEGTAALPTSGGSTVDQKFFLECTAQADPDNPFSIFQLTPDSIVQCGCQFVSTVLHPDPDLSTCEPFSLVFGPYTLVNTDLTCFVCSSSGDTSGEFYITITE